MRYLKETEVEITAGGDLMGDPGLQGRSQEDLDRFLREQEQRQIWEEIQRNAAK